MAWRCYQWLMWHSTFAYTLSHMPYSKTQDYHAKEGEQLTVLHICQGNHTQVWCQLIHWACSHEGLTHTLHISNARPSQTAQEVGQDIQWRDEDSTHLVAWVSCSEFGYLREVTKMDAQQQVKKQAVDLWFPQLNSRMWVGGILLQASMTKSVISSCCLEALGASKTSKNM